MKTLYSGLCLLMLAYGTPMHAQGAPPSPEEEYLNFAQGIMGSLSPHQGEVALTGLPVSLDVPEELYYLNPEDTEKVMVELWGNPPGSGNSTLGMLFPFYVRPFEAGAWGVAIGYEERGYVSDTGAANIDYDGLLAAMQATTRIASAAREQRGLGSIELVGWASRPRYDQATHALSWAKETRFSDQKASKLDYNIRVLGRKGVLVLGFVASMDERDTIDANVDQISAIPRFDAGFRYEDFDASVDSAAGYGIDALITGLIPASGAVQFSLAVFMRQFGVLLLAAIGVLGYMMLRCRA